MTCPFCTISPKQTRVLKRYKHTLVILSNPRLMPGHVLIIPKRHVEKISQLSITEKKELFKMLVIYQEKIISRIAPGCDIRQHYRPFQKQDTVKVDHIHFHLLPRKFKDNLYKKCQIREKDIFKKLSSAEAKSIKHRLSN